MFWCYSLEEYALQGCYDQIDIDKTQFRTNKLRIQVHELRFHYKSSDKRSPLPLLNRRNRPIQGSHL